MPTAPPEITHNSSDHEIELGGELILRCDYVGIPTPTGQWLLNGTELVDGVGGVRITGGAIGDFFVELQVSSVTWSSEGIYTCNVTNNIKSVETNFTVHIVSKSVFPLNTILHL